MHPHCKGKPRMLPNELRNCGQEEKKKITWNSSTTRLQILLPEFSIYFSSGVDYGFKTIAYWLTTFSQAIK